MLSSQQISSYESDGFLIIKDLLTAEETENLKIWAQEVHDWPTDSLSPWMPYEEINAQGQRVLCRTENYAGSHAGLNSILRSQKLFNAIRQLTGEDMLLFKEKINYKLAGSGGFAPHIDSVGYTQGRRISHVSALLAVDPSSVNNGGLEVVRGSHRETVPVGRSNNIIEPEWVAQQKWEPVELEPGEVLVFGSYLAHRSGPNTSNQDRKAVYATYNRATEGDLHEQYSSQRRVDYPPSNLRKPGEVFGKGALRHAFGSPMLSVDVGHQIVF